MPSPSRLRVHVSGPARRDISDILRWSLREFGKTAALRYEALIHRAFRNIAGNPERPGVQQRPELGAGVLVYHLRHSRARTELGTVRAPRHFVVYRLSDQDLDILRLVHDVRDLERPIPA